MVQRNGRELISLIYENAAECPVLWAGMNAAKLNIG